MRYVKEILLIEAILFCLCWMMSSYIATLLTFIAVPIFSGILLVSLIAEKIEKSKISKTYFYLMAGLTAIPIGLFMLMLMESGDGIFDWAK